MDVQLPINALEVRLDSTDCDTELLGDLPSRGSLCHQPQHLPLTFTQRFVGQLVPVLPPLLEEGQCSMLSGSQSSQRGFLHLGEAGHPADVQALVGSLASERAQALAYPRLPLLLMLLRPPRRQHFPYTTLSSS